MLQRRFVVDFLSEAGAMNSFESLPGVWRTASYRFCRWCLWFRASAPRRLRRRSRVFDAQFDQFEKLFLRCQKEWIDQHGQVKPANIHFPDQSVNRERYSKPRDVLLAVDTRGSASFLLWGVAFVQVADIPHPMVSEGNVQYQFTVEHDPLEHNYAHSELRVYKNGVREQTKKKINQEVKKRYRIELARRSRLLIRALV
jgi:hypothetical protein